MVAQRKISRRLSDAHVRLTRSSTSGGTPGVVITDRDLPQLDDLTGSRSRSYEVLNDLVAAERLRPVRRGAYALLDAAGTVRVDVLDLIAALTPKPYLVTAGRALQFHELTDQHFRRADVLVRTQIRSWSWRGTTVIFSKSSSSFARSTTRTRRTPAAIATPERALADSLEHPGWGVTLVQVAEALDVQLQRDPESADRLALLVADVYGHALARRLGFLISLLAGHDRARSFLALLGRSKGATPLSSRGPLCGPIDSLWNVRINIDTDLLLQHRESH